MRSSTTIRRMTAGRKKARSAIAEARAANVVKEYEAWSRMISKAKLKEIEIDPRWAQSFWDFLEDVGTKPKPDWWLAREDKTGPFDSLNCGWLSPRQACKTRRSGH